MGSRDRGHAPEGPDGSAEVRDAPAGEQRSRPAGRRVPRAPRSGGVPEAGNRGEIHLLEEQLRGVDKLDDEPLLIIGSVGEQILAVHGTGDLDAFDIERIRLGWRYEPASDRWVDLDSLPAPADEDEDG